MFMIYSNGMKRFEEKEFRKLLMVWMNNDGAWEKEIPGLAEEFGCSEFRIRKHLHRFDNADWLRNLKARAERRGSHGAAMPRPRSLS